MSDSAEAAKCLSLEQREDGVAILRIDVKDHRLNLLRASFSEELERMLDMLESADGVKAVVFTSGSEMLAPSMVTLVRGAVPPTV